MSLGRAQHCYWVYILSNKYHGTVYIGVTGSLYRRIWQHKTKDHEGFSKRYRLDRLVYYEQFGDIRQAIARESELKGWRRDRKIALIEIDNPGWGDLSTGWYDEAWILRCAQNDR